MMTPHEAAKPIIQVENLTMAYGSHVIQSRMSFTINRGDIFVVMGGSGCGKSTLLRLLRTPLAPEDEFWEMAAMAANLHVFTLHELQAMSLAAGFSEVDLRTAAGNSWPFTELASAFGASVGETVQKLAGLTLPSPTLQELQADYLKQATELWNTAADAPEKLAPADRRFAAGDWSGNHMAAFTAGMYLLNARTMLRMAESLQGDEKSRQRVRFAVQQFIDAASPSNYLALNPEVQRLAVESGGKTLQAGLDQLLADLPLSTPWQHADSYSGLHLYVIRLSLSKITKSHRQVFESLRGAGIGVNLHYIPVHTQPFYRKLGFAPGDFPEAERYYSEAISLPLYPTMTEAQQDRVAAALREAALR